MFTFPWSYGQNVLLLRNTTCSAKVLNKPVILTLLPTKCFDYNSYHSNHDPVGWGCSLKQLQSSRLRKAGVSYKKFPHRLVFFFSFSSCHVPPWQSLESAMEERGEECIYCLKYHFAHQEDQISISKTEAYKSEKQNKSITKREQKRHNVRLDFRCYVWNQLFKYLILNTLSSIFGKVCKPGICI